MLASLKAASDLVKVGIGALLGAIVVGALAWALTLAYASWIMVPAARSAATVAENARWLVLREAAEAAAELARQKAQAEVAAAEAALIARDRIRDAEMAALEAALQEEKNDAKPAVAGAAAICRPAVPRRLSIALDRLGRAAAGHGVGNAPRALP